MAVVAELIRSEANGTISFGDYTLGAKSKLDNFEHAGDLYKVKTFREITKLERSLSLRRMAHLYMNLFQELQLQIWQHPKTVWNLK